MQLQEVTALRERRRYPSLSLLTSAPSGDVQQSLRFLARQLGPRLELEFPPEVVAPLMASVERTIRAVEPDSQTLGVAVFVNDVEARWESLPVTVRDRVVIDETFATRDIVRAVLRTHRYRVLTLGDTVQLYDGLGDLVSPTTVTGFPLVIEKPAGEPVQRRQRRERADLERRRLRMTTRLVDDILDPVMRDDPLPLFAIGVHPRLSHFVRSSRHRRSIIASTFGAPGSPDGVRTLVHPLMASWVETVEHDALAQIDEGRSRRLLATGIAEVWTLARQGRGDLLVVEEGFEFPAEVDATTEYPISADDPTAPHVVDDLVDEAIEAVLACRGRIAFLPDGSLNEYERVALTLRY